MILIRRNFSKRSVLIWGVIDHYSKSSFSDFINLLTMLLLTFIEYHMFPPACIWWIICYDDVDLFHSRAEVIDITVYSHHCSRYIWYHLCLFGKRGTSCRIKIWPDCLRCSRYACHARGVRGKKILLHARMDKITWYIIIVVALKLS